MPKPIPPYKMLEALVTQLQHERESRELSMNGLAQDAGISQQMVSYVERGMRMPTLDTVLKLTDAMEIDFAEFVQKATDRARAGRQRKKP